MSSAKKDASKVIPPEGVRLWAAAVVAAAVLSFWGTLSYPFLHDDLTAIGGSRIVQEGGPLVEAFTKDYWGHSAAYPGGDAGRDRLYRPAVTLSLVANHYLGGNRPEGYRALNVGLHAAASLLLLGMGLGFGLRPAEAGAAAVIFAAHPLHTEAVMAVVGRADLMAAIGVFGAMIMLGSGSAGTDAKNAGADIAGKPSTASGGGSPSAGGSPAGSVFGRGLAVGALFALAIFSKETGAALIGWAALWWLWRRAAERWIAKRDAAGRGPVTESGETAGGAANPVTESENPAPDRKSKGIERKRIATETGGNAGSFGFRKPGIFALGGVLALYLGMRYWALGAWTRPGLPSLLDNPLAHEGLAGRLVGALGVLGRYLGLIIWPRPLTIDYSYAQILPWSAESLAWAAAGAGAMALWGWAAWRWRAERPEAAFGLALFLAAYFPASNLALPIGTVMAERLMYIPSAGVLIAAAPPLAGALAHRSGKIALAALSAALLLLGGLSWERNREWSDYLVFWERAARVSPESARTLRVLGQSLSRRGRFLEAVAPLRKATRILPAYEPAWTELGIALMQSRRGAEAEDALKEALRLNPRSPESLLAIGALYLGGGQLAEARVHLEKAVSLYPRFVEARFRLGNLYIKKHEFERAAAQFRAALGRAPNRGDIHHNLALVLFDAGDVETARRHARRAVHLGFRLRPELARRMGLVR
jgi:Flp pilus assembly protein TadD